MKFPMNDVVVVVPGIAGSVLQRNGKDVWAHSGSAIGRGLLTLGRAVKQLELPADIGADEPDDGVTATKLIPGMHLIPGLWGIDGYEGLGDYLSDKFQLTRATHQQPGNYLEFPYDWRLSNIASARRLKAAVEPVLEQWRDAHRDLPTDPKLVFICHSMGGLVARYYVELLGGDELTRRLITIGTPYRGSVNALDFLANGYQPGWGPVRINLSKLMASFPSVYELLPTYACIETLDGMRDLATVDVPNIAAQRIADARSFHDAISTSVRERTELGYELTPIKGQMQPTSVSGVVTTNGIETLDSYEGDDRIRGDGTVPRLSSHPAEWEDEQEGRTIYTAGRHAALQNAGDVQTQLHGLLSAGSIKKPMGGVPIGITMPDLINLGDNFDLTAVAEDSGLLLQAVIEKLQDHSQVRYSLTNKGDGRYGAEIADLRPGAYRVTVGSAVLQQPVDAVTDVFVVWDPEEEV